MDKRVKDLWLAALRSGDYPKGENALRNTTGFCCLGVLCDLHAKETGHTWEGCTLMSYYGRTGLLPPVVMRWAGIPTSLSVGGRGVEYILADANDLNDTFDPVIEIIEKEL